MLEELGFIMKERLKSVENSNVVGWGRGQTPLGNPEKHWISVSADGSQSAARTVARAQAPANSDLSARDFSGDDAK